MDDDAGALRDHRRQQGAIETNGGHQVLVQLLRPLRVVERREPAARALEPPSTLTRMSMPPSCCSTDRRRRCAPSGGREIRGEVSARLGRLEGARSARWRGPSLRPQGAPRLHARRCLRLRRYEQHGDGRAADRSSWRDLEELRSCRARGGRRTADRRGSREITGHRLVTMYRPLLPSAAKGLGGVRVRGGCGGLPRVEWLRDRSGCVPRPRRRPRGVKQRATASPSRLSASK